MNDSVLKIPRFPTGTEGAIWEVSHNERHIFVVYDTKTIYSYVYIRDSIDGTNHYNFPSLRSPRFNVGFVIE